MPLTIEQATRRRAEEKLRGMFDHFVMHLTDKELATLTDRWDSAEPALEAMARAGTRRPVTRPVCENGVWHEKAC